MLQINWIDIDLSETNWLDPIIKILRSLPLGYASLCELTEENQYDQVVESTGV